VVNAIDDTMKLNGLLPNSQALRSALDLYSDQPDSPSRGKQPRRDREDFFKDGGWTWDKFWERFAGVIMANDLVPFSAIKNGIQLQNDQAMLRTEAEDARKKEAEDRASATAEARTRTSDYALVYGQMQEDPQIRLILDEGKVLTGDDVRVGDAGFEFEVPPNGAHVTLVYKLLTLCGFDNLEKKEPKPRTPSPGGPIMPETAPQLTVDAAAPVAADANQERWWDDVLAAAWTTLQEIHQAEICDGVVEQDVLAQVLVPPAGYSLLRNKILEELENREDQDGLNIGRESRRGSKEDVVAAAANKKPSIDTLCQRLGITMSRIEWLHRLFESFLERDKNNPDEVPVCLYPEAPAALSKNKMRNLMKELRPDMEEVEFEMRFRRIDVDMSNEVEFDEFVIWVREDEVRVAGAAPLQKMSFEELAVVYGESVELIKYIYDRFQDRFPPEERDGYPKNPKSLPKAEVRALVTSLAPDMSNADFETQFQMTTFSKKDGIEFDEFLEVLPLDDLPEEIRDCGDPGSP